MGRRCHSRHVRGCLGCARYEKAQRLGYVRLTDRAGVVRRLRALAALGWPTSVLARELGVSSQAVIAMRQESGEGATVATRARVAALYDRLSMATPPPSSASTRTRACAAAQGWPVPLAWDDETIDQPDAAPAEGWRRTPASSLAAKRAERAEAIRALSASGLTATEVGVRLGMRRDAVAQSLSRHKALQGDLSA